MKPAPIPENDAARVAVLRKLGLLDSPASASYDRIVARAADLLGVPIVLVSLVDDKRQWFKARVGLEVQETPREVSFCGHAVAQDAVLCVNDALADERFADNPLVTGAPHVQAYLGVPIHAASGEPIGTLCAIDQAPRAFSADDIQTLTRMAKLVEHLVARANPPAP
jgi:GAF domain-containing protein